MYGQVEENFGRRVRVTYTILQQPRTASVAEFAVQDHAGTVVCFMYFDVLRAGLDLEGRFWDLGCYAEIAASEFLWIRNQF
jgi:hypothetical protein